MKQKISKKEREQAEYQKWLSSLEKLAPKFARKTHGQKSTLLQYTLSSPPGRKLATERSLVTTGGSTEKAVSKLYTGDKMLGIGTMHKSNMVPIFKTEDAKDIATMRRN